MVRLYNFLATVVSALKKLSTRRTMYSCVWLSAESVVSESIPQKTAFHIFSLLFRIMKAVVNQAGSTKKQQGGGMPCCFFVERQKCI